MSAARTLSGCVGAAGSHATRAEDDGVEDGGVEDGNLEELYNHMVDNNRAEEVI